MNKHELFHDIGEGVAIGGAVGLGIALLGMFFGKDEPTQLQNENMMLRNYIAKMEANKPRIYTMADVTQKHREDYPDMTDDDWQEHLDNVNLKMLTS
jgi:hypothetical protein